MIFFSYVFRHGVERSCDSDASSLSWRNIECGNAYSRRVFRPKMADRLFSSAFDDHPSYKNTNFLSSLFFRIFLKMLSCDNFSFLPIGSVCRSSKKLRAVSFERAASPLSWPRLTVRVGVLVVSVKVVESYRGFYFNFLIYGWL